MKPFEIDLPSDELRFTYVRSSGAGGQNVNKVNSKAVLRWNPSTSRVLSPGARERFVAKFGTRIAADGDLVLSSDEERDQGRNASNCLKKLREMISSIWFPPKKRRATKPTFGSKQRRLKAKKVNSEKKQNRRIKE